MGSLTRLDGRSKQKGKPKMYSKKRLEERILMRMWEKVEKEEVIEDG